MTHPSVPDLECVTAILAVIADPAAARKRLDEFAAASNEARAQIEQAQADSEALDAKLAEHRAVMSREKSAHAGRLATERRDHEAVIAEREIATAALHAKAQADAAAVAASKTEWANLLSRTKAA